MSSRNGLSGFTITYGRRMRMTETFAEKLDNARNGQEFQSGLEGLFRALEKAMWEDDDE